VSAVWSKPGVAYQMPFHKPDPPVPSETIAMSFCAPNTSNDTVLEKTLAKPWTLMLGDMTKKKGRQRK